MPHVQWTAQQELERAVPRKGERTAAAGWIALESACQTSYALDSVSESREMGRPQLVPLILPLLR